MAGVEPLEVEALLEFVVLSLLLPLELLEVANFPAVCFVTAAAMPPLSLACFLSFFEGIQLVVSESKQSPASRKRSRSRRTVVRKRVESNSQGDAEECQRIFRVALRWSIMTFGI